MELVIWRFGEQPWQQEQVDLGEFIERFGLAGQAREVHFSQSLELIARETQLPLSGQRQYRLFMILSGPSNGMELYLPSETSL